MAQRIPDGLFSESQTSADFFFFFFFEPQTPGLSRHFKQDCQMLLNLRTVAGTVADIQ